MEIAFYFYTILVMLVCIAAETTSLSAYFVCRKRCLLYTSRGRGGCAKRRCARLGAHPIVTTRWNRLSAWPSVACILLHSHSRTASRVLEYRQQRASASAPPHEAAHCGNRALVSPTTPVRSSQPKGNEEARWLHPRYASDTKPLCRSCARPTRESEPFCAAERTRCRICLLYTSRCV